MITPSPSVIVIVGPTASGKTAVAVRVAETIQTEIISADSMQFYRHMQIGTGAPSKEELARVRHHFVAFLEPGEEFSAGAFEVAARQVVRDLNAQGKPAVVAGGSGLYVRALIDGLFPGPSKNETIRSRLRHDAQILGVPALYARLNQIDPEYAAVINANDLRRIIRALEVFEITGKPLSALHKEHRAAARSLDAIQFGLEMPRTELYDRINARVDCMLDAGLLDEVRFLLDHGYADAIDQLRCLGYRELAACIRGETPFEQAVELMKRNTRHFAKRQLTWFRADARIHWIPAGVPRTQDAIVEEILRMISS